MAKPKPSHWLVTNILVFTFLILIGLMTWIKVDPSVMDTMNKTKVTEQNFQKELIAQGQIASSKVPVLKTIMFKSADGVLVPREVKIYSYGADINDGHYVLYYYPKDNVKQVAIRKAISSAPKVAEVKVTPWYVTTYKWINSWPVWTLAGKAYIEPWPNAQF